MVASELVPLSVLYEQDETAWLEAMSVLLAEGRVAEIDQKNLCEYLSDMANRDRREVTSRLRTLIAHLLKWRFQPDRRTGSWHETILIQRHELDDLLDSGTLHNHALEVLERSYGLAAREAAAETGLAESAFPVECPFTLDEILNLPLTDVFFG